LRKIIRRCVYDPAPGDALTPDDFLPELCGIASELGVEAALEIVHHFGGVQLYVPQKLREGSPTLVLGVGNALKLCRLFGPARIDIPLQPFDKAALRRLVVLRFHAGASNSEIARSLNASWRVVTRILGEAGLARPPGWATERQKVPGRIIYEDSDALLTRAGEDDAAAPSQAATQPSSRASGHLWAV
jgi:hypothetical protein